MKTIGIFALVLLAGFLISHTVVGYVSLPIVQTSVSTGKCVGVYQADDQNWSCDNLPERYHHEFVF